LGEDLAEEAVVRFYGELSRKAATLSEDVAMALWLHEHTCRIAVDVMREENRSIDRAALKEERQALSTLNRAQPAPAGLATRVSQGILLKPARHKRFRFPLRMVWKPAWTQPARIGGGVVCVLVIVLWMIPHPKRNPLVQAPEWQMTPASFAQLASPEEAGITAKPMRNGP
jgi:hypothetical protein